MVKFHYNHHRERVRKASVEHDNQQEMKRQNIGIGVHLPKDIREGRKPLYDVMRQAKNADKEVKFVGKYLYIDGLLYKPANQERMDAL